MENNLYIGIDLGTSSVKTILINSQGEVLKEAKESYELIVEKNLFSEQKPDVWFEKTILCLKRITKGNNENIKSLSFSGQMHGLVTIDNKGIPLHNAILWNDQRTHQEVEEIKDKIGINKILKLTANMPLEGFTLPKILWLKKHKKAIYNKIHKILLPKDYLIFKLTGKVVTDVTDASGTGMFNVEKKQWAFGLIEELGLNKNILPKVCESLDEVGVLQESIKNILKLKNDIKVIVGAGDQAANAIGLGVIDGKKASLSLGTSACLFVASDHFGMSPNLHSFAHSTGNYHLMGVSQSGGGSVKWFGEEILGISNYKIINNFSYRDNKVFFLPYLSGERHPIHDPFAKALFVGMDRGTTKVDMFQSVMEGVAFSIKQMLDIINGMGIKPKEILVAGGAGDNEDWMNIIASILNLKISVAKGNHGGAMGAAIIAMAGINNRNIKEVCKDLVKVEKTFLPNKKQNKYLNNKYKVWKKIYPSIKEIYLQINNLEK